MDDSKYSRLRLLTLLSLIVSLHMSTLSKGQVVEFQGYGVRQHIMNSADTYGKRVIGYEKASVSLILEGNSLVLTEKYTANNETSVKFEIKNEVFNETAFYFDLIDVNNPNLNLKGQFKPRQGEFVIMFLDDSIATVYLNLKRKKSSSDQILNNKEAWENR